MALVLLMHKAPLTTIHLQSIFTALHQSRDHDDMLFLSMLRLGEMTVNNNPQLRDFRKIILCNSFNWVRNNYEFLLPAQKTDTTFEGNCVHISQIMGTPNPQPIMRLYLDSRDQLFPLHPQLWWHNNGSSPTHSWFLHHLRQYCPSDIVSKAILRRMECL